MKKNIAFLSWRFILLNIGNCPLVMILPDSYDDGAADII